MVVEKKFHDWKYNKREEREREREREREKERERERKRREREKEREREREREISLPVGSSSCKHFLFMNSLAEPIPLSVTIKDITNIFVQESLVWLSESECFAVCILWSFSNIYHMFLEFKILTFINPNFVDKYLEINK